MSNAAKADASGDAAVMRQALRLAQRARGKTSPNPMVGAVLIKHGKIIGQGWHHGAGQPHAEIEAMRDAEKRGEKTSGATLYVTLEPCSTHGRTGPCTAAIKKAEISKVVVAATDPNPAHSGRGFKILKRAGVEVATGVLADEANRLNEVFNHWIVKKTPFVTVKAAMTLDGKIATAKGESKWITGEQARAQGMMLRAEADAILVGINTILADDPGLTVRKGKTIRNLKQRIVLDSLARTPLKSKIVTDKFHASTTIVATKAAPAKRVKALAKKVRVIIAPEWRGKIDLRWLLGTLGAEEITSLLVEGGGEVNASFLLDGLAQRVAFFYAPKILGGRDARKGVAGEGIKKLTEAPRLHDVEWRWLGTDLWLTGRL